MTTKAIVNEILAQERVDGFVMDDRDYDIALWVDGLGCKFSYSDYWMLKQVWNEDICFNHERGIRLELIGLIEITGDYGMGDGWACRITPRGEFVLDVIWIWLDAIPF